MASGILVFSLAARADEHSLTYLILADTVEPLMIASESHPMAGGIVTDTLKSIFLGSPHEIKPLIIPWQRMKVEMRERSDWIMYGMPSQCDSGCAHSADPIVLFDHVVVTLKDNPVEIREYQDLFEQRLLLVENFHYPGLDQHLATPVEGVGSGEIRDIRAFTPEGGLKMLRHGRGDAYIDWRFRVFYNLKKAGLSLDDVRLTEASNLIPIEAIHFFYSDKLDPALRQLIDKRMASMRADGSQQQIIDRYGKDM